LWLAFADQRCERFSFDDTIAPDDTFHWGDLHWRAIAAPGHDMAALMFFCEEAGLLISGDALANQKTVLQLETDLLKALQA